MGFRDELSGLVPGSTAVTVPMLSVAYPATVAAGCAAAEVPLAVTEAQVEAIYGRSDVTQQEPFEAFARLGLAIVQREALK